MLLRLIAYVLILLAGVITGLRFYYRLPRSYAFLAQYLIWILAGELVAIVSGRVWGINYPVYHLLQLISVTYYGLIFYYFLRAKRNHQRLCLILTVICFFGSVLLSLFVQDIQTFPSYASMLLSVFVVSLSLVVFYQMLLYPTDMPLLQQPVFWFTASSLFFYALTFFVFGYLQVLLAASATVPRWVYIPIWMGNYVLYLSYLLSLYFASRTKLSSIWKIR